VIEDGEAVFMVIQRSGYAVMRLCGYSVNSEVVISEVVNSEIGC